jgi:acyl-CoA synthetase (AMP-forming)/AMP-acid ligase II
MHAITHGRTSYLMSPLDFLKRPMSWLHAISRYEAFVAGAPNFAYDLCTRRADPMEMEGLDLRGWRVAFCGAEPVRAETLERFAVAFAGVGFRHAAFSPCYGLAEATLVVSSALPEDEPLVLERGAAPNAASEARRLVAVGAVVPEHHVCIIDPTTRRTVVPGAVGEVWVSGPSVARGYWHRDDETTATFQAMTYDGSGPYLRSGDLGFLANGSLVIAGRTKDALIVHGRTVQPHDIEDAAVATDTRLRPGCGAAFCVDDGTAEKVFLVQEAQVGEPSEARLVAANVRQAVLQAHGVLLDDVILVAKGQLPKTSSGKIRRSACRDAYLSGALDVLDAVKT